MESFTFLAMYFLITENFVPDYSESRILGTMSTFQPFSSLWKSRF